MSVWRLRDVQHARKLLLVASLAVPAAASAQIVVGPTRPPDATQQFPLTIFKDPAPPSTGDWSGSIKGTDWWKLPESGSQIPRWKMGSTVALSTPGGLTFSGGLFGRRGDPLPLYLSEGAILGAAGNSLRGPGSYRLQWDTKFRVSAPVWTSPRLKIHAVGELFVPLTRPQDAADPSASFLTSRNFRFGLVTVF